MLSRTYDPKDHPYSSLREDLLQLFYEDEAADAERAREMEDMLKRNAKQDEGAGKQQQEAAKQQEGAGQQQQEAAPTIVAFLWSSA